MEGRVPGVVKTVYEQMNRQMKDIEFELPERIKAFQEGLLRNHLVYLRDNSPYYRRLFDSYGINTEKIHNLEDLTRIPFTEKKDSSFTMMTSAVYPRKR